MLAGDLDGDFEVAKAVYLQKMLAYERERVRIAKRTFWICFAAMLFACTSFVFSGVDLLLGNPLVCW